MERTLQAGISDTSQVIMYRLCDLRSPKLLTLPAHHQPLSILDIGQRIPVCTQVT